LHKKDSLGLAAMRYAASHSRIICMDHDTSMRQIKTQCYFMGPVSGLIYSDILIYASESS
jgi:hypothetical protein